MPINIRSISLLLGLTLAIPASAQNQGIQDLLRGQIPGISGVSTGPRPQPAVAGSTPRELSNVQSMPLRKRVICKFPDENIAGHRFEDRSKIENRHEVFVQRPGEANFQISPEELIQLYDPNDFERYVKSATGKELCRFGHQATYDIGSFFEPPPLSMVPEDYVLGPGDEVFIRLWGSVEQDIALVIDRSGQVVIPRVGPIRLAGVRYGQAARVSCLPDREFKH